MKRILLVAVLAIGAPFPVLAQTAGETPARGTLEQEKTRLERELYQSIWRERILTVIILVVGLSSLALWRSKAVKPAPEVEVADEMSALGREVEVMELERKLAEAILANDAQMLDRLFADDLTLTTISGRVLEKAQAITEFGNAKYWAFKADDVAVQVFGDVAIVTGRTKRGGHTQRIDVSAQYRFTRVYVRRNGRAQIVAAQSTSIT
jgi:ketosteroid isomerase-like protein